MSNQIVRVGSVSYINAKPLIYGFETEVMKNDVQLVFDYPASIASKLVNGDLDIGLVPIAILPRLPFYQIISDYGIACDGEVASVCLYSEVQLEEIEEIWLDYQSRSSVALLKILLSEYWKISPRLMDAGPDYEKAIAGSRAGLVIGDRALALRGRFPYVFDLGKVWKELTGLPFVFAAWVSNREFPPDFCRRFNEATSFGLSRLDEVIAGNPYREFSLHDYYTRYIKFRLDTRMHEAIALFLNKLQAYQ
jgi:chorismate dehydratase